MRIPVEITAGALLLDNQSGTVLAQIKYKNISGKSIKSIAVDIYARDGGGARITGVKGYCYEGLIAAPGDFFGDKNPIVMSDKNAHEFSVDILSVEFSDGTKWSKRGQEAVNTAKEVGAQTVETIKETPKVAAKIVKLPALFVNIILSIAMIVGEFSTIKDFVSEPSARLGTAMVLLGAATIVGLPGFHKVLFPNKHGIAQRLLRWAVFAGIIAIDILIMAVVF